MGHYCLMTVPTFGEGAAVGRNERRQVSKPAVAAASAGLLAAGAAGSANADRFVRMKSPEDELRRKRLQSVSDARTRRVARMGPKFDRMIGEQQGLIDRAGQMDAFASGKGTKKIKLNGLVLDRHNPNHHAVARAERDALNRQAWTTAPRLSEASAKMADERFRRKDAYLAWKNHIKSNPADRRAAKFVARAGKTSAIVGAVGLGALGVNEARKFRQGVAKADSRYPDIAIGSGAVGAAGYGAHRYAMRRVESTRAAGALRQADLNRAASKLRADRETQRLAFRGHMGEYAKQTEARNKLSSSWDAKRAYNETSGGRKKYIMAKDPLDPSGPRIRIVPGGGRQHNELFVQAKNRHVAAGEQALTNASEMMGRHSSTQKKYATARAEAESFKPAAASARWAHVSRGGKVAAVLGGAGALGAMALGERSRMKNSSQPRFAGGAAVGSKKKEATQWKDLIRPTNAERAAKKAHKNSLVGRGIVSADKASSLPSPNPDSWLVTNHQFDHEKKATSRRIYGV